MNPVVTYGQLHQFLLGLGFQDDSREHLLFVHPERANALLRFAFHEPDESMLERDLVKVRTLLDLSGLLDRDRFDEWVRELNPQRAA